MSKVPSWLLSITLALFVAFLIFLYATKTNFFVGDKLIGFKSTGVVHAEGPRANILIKGGNDGTKNCNDFCSDKQFPGALGICVSGMFIAGSRTGDQVDCQTRGVRGENMFCACSVIVSN